MVPIELRGIQLVVLPVDRSFTWDRRAKLWVANGSLAASLPRPHGRIQFDFIFNDVRYRPSIKRPPSEANLRRAREQLEIIKQQINLGVFSFEEEFPDYGGSNGQVVSEDPRLHLAPAPRPIRILTYQILSPYIHRRRPSLE